MYKHVLVPTDGTELSLVAVEKAARFARALNARITVLYVQPEYPKAVTSEALIEPRREDFLRRCAAKANDIFADAADVLEPLGLSYQCRTGVSNTPWQSIITTAQLDNCDLVFMASHGRRGLAGMLIGSETQKVLTHCQIPVLVCR